MSSLRRGHANLLCIGPILSDDPRKGLGFTVTGPAGESETQTPDPPAQIPQTRSPKPCTILDSLPLMQNNLITKFSQGVLERFSGTVQNFVEVPKAV